MNPTSNDIAELIEGESALGLVYTSSTGRNLFIGREPSESEGQINVVTIQDIGGAEPQLTFSQSTSDYYRPNINIRCRNKSYSTGYSLIFDITAFLHARGKETINSTRYELMRALNDPQFLEWDENKRAIFIVNFEIQRK